MIGVMVNPKQKQMASPSISYKFVYNGLSAVSHVSESSNIEDESTREKRKKKRGHVD